MEAYVALENFFSFFFWLLYGDDKSVLIIQSRTGSGTSGQQLRRLLLDNLDDIFMLH